MPTPTTFLGILLAVAVAWGSMATWYAKTLVEDKATVEAALKEANANTLEQKRINGELKSQVAAEQRAVAILQEERRNDDIRYQKELSRIARERSTSEAAARAYPERYGAIATFRFRRVLRDVCRSGGGDQDTCKIEPVRPAKASPGSANQPDTEAPAGVAGN